MIADVEAGRPDEPGEVGVILNPRAARGKAIELVPDVVDVLRRLEVAHHLHVTTAPREAIEVARRFADEGKTRVLAVGGDGTINETVNGLLDAKLRPVLGVVPASRGSDFARSLQTPRKLADAISAAVSAPPRRIDAALARFDDGEERAFVNVGGLGFDAVVAERANGSRVPGSTLPYLAAIIRTLAAYRNIEVAIEADGQRTEERVCAVLVANGRYVAGGMQIAPDAALDDGKLDLAIIGDIAKPDLLRTLPKVFSGRHVSHPKFRQLRAESVRVECRDGAAVQVDGEVIGRAPVTFTILPGALLVAG